MTKRRRSAEPKRDPKTGRWYFRVDVGVGPNGERQQTTRRGFRTRKKAQEELDKIRVQRREGTLVQPNRRRLAEWLHEWLETQETAGLRATTIASYRRNFRLHVAPRVGGVQLQALTASHLDRLYAELLRTGNRKTGGGLSSRTVRYLHTIIHKALSDAARKGLLARNVAAAATPPSARDSRAPEPTWWTPAELRAFLASVAEDDLYPLFRLAAMSGMRRGEVCGLAWPEVDLEAGIVAVRRQLVTVDHEPRFEELPKTDHGRRTIELDAETITVLRAHRAAQLEARLAVGDGYRTDLDLVFAQPDGSPLHPEAVAKVFARRVARTDLPRLRFHDLRHTHCSHLIAAGQDPKVISQRLGHHSVSFTYDKYGHLMPEAGSGAAHAVADLVDGTDGR